MSTSQSATIENTAEPPRYNPGHGAREHMYGLLAHSALLDFSAIRIDQSLGDSLAELNRTGSTSATAAIRDVLDQSTEVPYASGSLTAHYDEDLALEAHAVNNDLLPPSSLSHENIRAGYGPSKPEWLVNYGRLITSPSLGVNAPTYFAAKRGRSFERAEDFLQWARAEYPDPKSWVDEARIEAAFYDAHPDILREQLDHTKQLLSRRGRSKVPENERMEASAFLTFYSHGLDDRGVPLPEILPGQDGYDGHRRHSRTLNNLAQFIYGREAWNAYKSDHNFDFRVRLADPVIEMSHQASMDGREFTHLMHADEQETFYRDREPLLSKEQLRQQFGVDAELVFAVSVGIKGELYDEVENIRRWGVLRSIRSGLNYASTGEQSLFSLQLVPIKEGELVFSDAVDFDDDGGQISLDPDDRTLPVDESVILMCRDGNVRLANGDLSKRVVAIQTTHLSKTASIESDFEIQARQRREASLLEHRNTVNAVLGISAGTGNQAPVLSGNTARTRLGQASVRSSLTRPDIKTERFSWFG